MLGGDVIKGGPGNDMLTAGAVAGSNDTTAPSGAFSYIYGDAGNDTIWGEDDVTDQYIWGGDDDDIIYGADGNSKQIISGNDDNDTIHPGSNATTYVAVSGDKGYDSINPLTPTLDGNGNVSGWTPNAMNNAEEKFYGGDGPDKVFGGWQTVGPILIKGNDGNDKLYGGFMAGGTQTIVGNEGSDHIRTDYY